MFFYRNKLPDRKAFKTAFIVIAAVFSFQVSAQERSVWTCRDSNNTGLRWDDRRWVDSEFRRSNFVLTLNGLESSISVNGQSTFLECKISVVPEIINCSDLLGTHLLFNTFKHVGTMSSIFGGVTGPGDNSIREPIQVKVFQCMRVQILEDSDRPIGGN